MAKRNPLTFDDKGLAENLQKSAAKGIDAFFTPVSPTSQADVSDTKDPVKPEPVQTSPIRKANRVVTKKDEPQSRKHDVMTASNHESMNESMQSSNHDIMIESIRKAVKDIGKEQTTHRTTLEEKRAVANIVFEYSQLDIRTSENEIARIAVSFLVDDYRRNGENSILHKVLIALNT